MFSRSHGIAAVLALAILATNATAASPTAKAKKPAQAEWALADVPYEGHDAVDAMVPADSAMRLITEPYERAWSGARNGDVTLVIFADYGCPACREAQKVTDRLIAEDPNLRVVYRLIALEGYSGRAAANASLDAAREQVYVESGSSQTSLNQTDWNAFHRALMAQAAVTGKAIANVASARKIAPNVVFLDYENSGGFPFHPNSMSYDSELAGNESQLFDRGGESLPAWTIGDGQVTEGHDYAAIRSAIASARVAAKN